MPSAVTILMLVFPLPPNRSFERHLQNQCFSRRNQVLKQSSSSPPSYGSPLHLVVSLCQKSVVEGVLSAFCSDAQNSYTNWINSQNFPERETPLHIAAKLTRLDVYFRNINDFVIDIGEFIANSKSE